MYNATNNMHVRISPDLMSLWHVRAINTQHGADTCVRPDLATKARPFRSWKQAPACVTTQQVHSQLTEKKVWKIPCGDQIVAVAFFVYRARSHERFAMHLILRKVVVSAQAFGKAPEELRGNNVIAKVQVFKFYARWARHRKAFRKRSP
jgi:hypothetical protein